MFLENHFKQIFDTAEIRSGISLKNEYEVFPFCRFTINRIYMVDPGLGKRVIEKPIGLKKKDLLEVISHGVERLNVKRGGYLIYTQDDFIEGIYRTEPTQGALYELYFRDKDVDNSTLQYQRLVFYRPFGPIYLVKSQLAENWRQTIDIVLPLMGRVDKFRAFIERYINTGVKQDRRTRLTVVYFGDDGLADVRRILRDELSPLGDNAAYNLIQLSGNFSRGVALQAGANSLVSQQQQQQQQQQGRNDSLMFFCDVDIIFSTDFLERCRLNAEPGKRVYYPMVFSLYNPAVVYALNNVAVPSPDDQLVISKESGFWRDFGFGMTCQYRSDFTQIGGFDSEFKGWGEEDVYLYKKYLKSQYLVVRATDPGIFHQWHEKVCDPNMSNEQYHGCIRSKALNEASHSQLGMLAFKEEIDIHKSIKQKKVKAA